MGRLKVFLGFGPLVFFHSRNEFLFLGENEKGNKRGLVCGLSGAREATDSEKNSTRTNERSVGRTDGRNDDRAVETGKKRCMKKTERLRRRATATRRRSPYLRPLRRWKKVFSAQRRLVVAIQLARSLDFSPANRSFFRRSLLDFHGTLSSPFSLNVSCSGPFSLLHSS